MLTILCNFIFFNVEVITVLMSTQSSNVGLLKKYYHWVGADSYIRPNALCLH